MLRASELADRLQVSRGRISQLVAGGKLDGCFEGDGAQRRFDLVKAAAALGRRLDPGQMLGNGSTTRQALREIAAASDPEQDTKPAKAARKSDVLPLADSDRYELARTAKAEEDLRTARLRNGREEGLYVLASEVERQVAQVMGQEIRETEAFLKDAARLLADQMQVDFKVARKILMDSWRAHRQARAAGLAAAESGAGPSDAEKAAQI